ncbi:MAG: very short patch repair endonuclease [Flavobacteriales bacterium]|nr:very short patch repair endonuclease [Flavobacteriales bacterium]
MRGNRGKDTKPEMRLRKALWAAGIRGYRLHWKSVPGRPDISFPGRRIAIFVNGCYWHRCPHCDLPLPKSHQAFWKEKFEKNIARDERKSRELLDLQWKVHVIWECEIKQDIDACVHRVSALLENEEDQGR